MEIRFDLLTIISHYHIEKYEFPGKDLVKGLIIFLKHSTMKHTEIILQMMFSQPQRNVHQFVIHTE